MAWPPAVVCRRIALVVFGVSLLVYLMITGLFVAVGIDIRSVLVLSQLVALLGLALWLAQLMRLPAREAFALRPAAPVHWLMVVAAAFPLQVAGGALQFTIVHSLPEDSPMRRLMEETIGQFVAVDSAFDLIMLFLAAVVTAAVCEEFLFRGLLLQLLRRRAGWGSAIAWSAGLFAVYHLNPVVLLPVALVGAYLGILVWRSGSLYPAILAHALNNGLALFGLPGIVDEAFYARYLGIILAGSTALLAALLYAYLRATVPPQQLLSEPPPARWPGGLEGDRIDGGLGDREQTEHPQ
jgi:membrane protease YdiL (CAAX protease family)